MEKEHFPGKKNEKPFLQIEFWIQIVNAILHFFPRFFDMHILLIFFYQLNSQNIATGIVISRVSFPTYFMLIQVEFRQNQLNSIKK